MLWLQVQLEWCLSETSGWLCCAISALSYVWYLISCVKQSGGHSTLHTYLEGPNQRNTYNIINYYDTPKYVVDLLVRSVSNTYRRLPESRNDRQSGSGLVLHRRLLPENVPASLSRSIRKICVGFCVCMFVCIDPVTILPEESIRFPSTIYTGRWK